MSEEVHKNIDDKVIDPLHQFGVYKIIPLDVGGFDLSFTNMSFFMLLAAGIIAGFLFFATRVPSLIPSRIQCLAEMGYDFVAGIIRDNAGRESLRFFPIICSIFYFILVSNMIGMIPYSFTIMSHVTLTLMMALIIFIAVTVLAIWRHGFVSFFKRFVPSGLPIVLVPFLFVVEMISYLMRPISLSVRLFANMLAGHIMLKVFAAFVGLLGMSSFFLLAVFPFLFMIPLTLLELLVAFLQAYVFTALTCIYLGEAMKKDAH